MVSCCQNGDNTLPVDRGWSWVICFSSFSLVLLLGLAMQSSSVLFLELVAEFETSITTASLTIMLYVMAVSVSSIITTYELVPRFGERPVIVVASIMVGVCNIGYSLAPNIAIFLVFSTLQGTSCGMIFVPAMSIVSFYFNKWRSIATTITNSGVSVATIGFPPLIRLIVDEFGLRGTYLILGGIEFNMVAAALLLRPVSSYKQPTTTVPSITDKKDNLDESLVPLAPNDTTTPLQAKNEEYHMNEPCDDKFIVYNESYNFDTNGQHITDSLLKKSKSSENIIFDTDKDSHEKAIHPAALRRQTSVPVNGARQEISEVTSNGVHSNTTLENRCHGSMWSVATGVEAGEIKPTDETTKGYKNWCFCRIVKKIYDPDIFKSWGVRVFLILGIFGATNQYVLTYIPTIAVIQGATRDEGALILVIVGCVDLFGRFVVGFISDMKWLKPSRLMSIGQICLGIMCHAGRFCRTFESLIAWGVVAGLFIGIRMSLMAMVLIELVGVQKMSRAFSLIAFVSTLSAAIHSPLLSALMEETGNFNATLHYCGFALIVCGIGLFCLPWLISYDEKQNNKRQRNLSGHKA